MCYAKLQWQMHALFKPTKLLELSQLTLMLWHVFLYCLITIYLYELFCDLGPFVSTVLVWTHQEYLQIIPNINPHWTIQLHLCDQIDLAIRCYRDTLNLQDLKDHRASRRYDTCNHQIMCFAACPLRTAKILFEIRFW